MSPAAHNVIRRLDAARQKWWLFTLLSTAVLATCISFGTVLAFMLTDAFMKFSQFVLAGMFVAWLAVTIALIVLVCRRLGRSQRTLEATARRVEAEYPELGSDLINVVQLSSDSKNVDRAFCETAVAHAAAQIGHFRFEEAASKESAWQRFKNCMQTPFDLMVSAGFLGILILIAIACHLLIPNWGSAATRLMKPWKFVPSVGSVEIVRVTPGNTDVLAGSSLEIAAEIKNPEHKPFKATLFVTPDGEEESGLPMAADKEHLHYKLTLPSVQKPLEYRLEIGDSQTEKYHVGIRQKPTISEVEVTFHYPVYLGRPKETFVQKTADLEAPQYTVAELHIRPSAPIEKGHVQSGSQRLSGRVEHNGALLVVRLPLLKDTTFTIHLFDDGDRTDPDPRVNRV
ncbi:MAG TPA: hypothetical protein VMY37_22460, partial [Thermoguttaceae bacterium]|nr:hypothetical protein [Thermoguttaceae bacterium]